MPLFNMIKRPVADLAAPWAGGTTPHYQHLDEAVIAPNAGDGDTIWAEKRVGNNDSNEEEQWQLGPQSGHPKIFLVFGLDILIYARRASGESDCTWRSYHDGAWSSAAAVGLGTSFAWYQRTFPYSSSKKWGYSILNDWRMGVKTPTLSQKQNTHFVDTAYGVYRWWCTQAAISI